MVCTFVAMKAVERLVFWRQVLQRVPVDPFRGGLGQVNHRLQLPELIVPPGGVAGLGDPDGLAGAVVLDHLLDPGNVVVPALPDRLPGAGKPMHPDDIDVFERASFEHQIEPVGVEGLIPPSTLRDPSLATRQAAPAIISAKMIHSGSIVQSHSM